jgi:hypothetical protein
MMATMTVFFDDPFWVAVLELHHDGRVRAARQVFGAEPTDAEIYQYLLRYGSALLVRVERSAAVTRIGQWRRLFATPRGWLVTLPAPLTNPVRAPQRRRR